MKNTFVRRGHLKIVGVIGTGLVSAVLEGLLVWESTKVVLSGSGSWKWGVYLCLCVALCLFAGGLLGFLRCCVDASVLGYSPENVRRVVEIGVIVFGAFAGAVLGSGLLWTIGGCIMGFVFGAAAALGDRVATSDRVWAV